jgi:hypothetical protein
LASEFRKIEGKRLIASKKPYRRYVQKVTINHPNRNFLSARDRRYPFSSQFIELTDENLSNFEYGSLEF